MFSKSISSADGYYNYCSECSKEKCKKQREKQKEKIKDIVESKICCICKVEKETECFYKNKSSKDGFKSKCIVCKKKYDKELRLSKMK